MKPPRECRKQALTRVRSSHVSRRSAMRGLRSSMPQRFWEPPRRLRNLLVMEKSFGICICRKITHVNDIWKESFLGKLICWTPVLILLGNGLHQIIFVGKIFLQQAFPLKFLGPIASKTVLHIRSIGVEISK